MDADAKNEDGRPRDETPVSSGQTGDWDPDRLTQSVADDLQGVFGPSTAKTPIEAARPVEPAPAPPPPEPVVISAEPVEPEPVYEPAPAAVVRPPEPVEDIRPEPRPAPVMEEAMPRLERQRVEPAAAAPGWSRGARTGIIAAAGVIGLIGGVLLSPKDGASADPAAEASAQGGATAQDVRQADKRFREVLSRAEAAGLSGPVLGYYREQRSVLQRGDDRSRDEQLEGYAKLTRELEERSSAAGK